MPIVSGNFAKALWPGINSWYGKAYDEHRVECVDLFDTHNSGRQYEEDVGISSFGLAPVKPEGSPVSYDTEIQGFVTRYSHVEYALGFIITQIMMEDDLYDVVGERRAKGLAFSMRQTKEVVAANVYNNAFSSSFVGGDGLSLLNAAHVNVRGANYANVPTTGGALSEATLEEACIDIMQMKNDRDLNISLIPQKLIIPPSLVFEAERILETDKSTTLGPSDQTNKNDINALKSMGRFPQGVAVNHYLTTSDTAWFIRTNCPDGMKHFERRADAFEVDNDFDTSNAKYKASARYSFGWTDPRALFGDQGT